MYFNFIHIWCNLNIHHSAIFLILAYIRTDLILALYILYLKLFQNYVAKICNTNKLLYLFFENLHFSL